MSAPDANCWMRDIPADIDLIATDIASLIPSRVVTVNRTFAAIVIARAILAERERCAVVAEGFSRRGREWLADSVWDNIKRDTAKAIRTPPSQPTSSPSEKTSAAQSSSAAEGQSPAPQEAP